MRLPRPRGDLSAQLIDALASGTPETPALAAGGIGDPSTDDVQLALWILYEQHYRGFEDVDPSLEWSPDLLRLRRTLETPFEAWICDLTATTVKEATEEGDDVVAQLEHLTRDQSGALARHLHREATAEQYRDFLVQRSIYHLKESDPHAWALPRLDGPAKVALAELQYDEYGDGVSARLHSRLFADALEGAGLDPSYGAYVDRASAPTLVANNAMSLFGLHRRLRGAAMGHLAAFEMTSSLPCRRYVQGAERLGLDERVVRYFDEHVEADAVHEQLAARAICGSMVEAEPDLHDDVLLGAAACLVLEGLAGDRLLEEWR
ncbi:MAG: iron-containing redox enzyme family protein [Nocardioidaceae bacterium]|nr:iron-containing redox enzyme family protein [Nocardioidaceae bacterium]MCL2614428.1 iron-containing redox enzyme family protein [Nocardioidaceae bacterium]